MKKSVKRILSLVLSLAMAATVMVGMSITASAEAKVIVLDVNEDLYSWTNQSQGSLDIDEKDFMEGSASISLDLPGDEEGTINGGVFASMVVLNFDPVDVTEYTYFEMWKYQSVDMKGGAGLQLNFCDPDLAQDDGINVNNAIDRAPAGWARVTVDVASNPSAIPATNRENIGHMRISWLCYNDGVYYECDWKYDGLMFFNKEFLDARKAEEARVNELVTPLEVPTADNVDEKEAGILAVKEQIDAAKEAYPNFTLKNIAKWDRVYDAYMELQKGEMVAAAKQKIIDIGGVNKDNFTEKETLITAAEAAVKELDDTFGKGTYELTETALLTQARSDFDNFTSAKAVTDLIVALPDIAEMTLEDKAAVEAADNAYKALKEGAKAVITAEDKTHLDECLVKLYELEHPYKLGELDANEGVQASDALIALQGAVKKIELTELEILAADVNGDEVVTAADALSILQYAVKKIDKFPIEAVVE